MSGFFAITTAFTVVGLAIYAGIVFFAGRRGWWWLGILVTAPGLMGGLMSLMVDTSQSRNPVAQNFGWWVIGQVIIGVVAYFLGRKSAPNISE